MNVERIAADAGEGKAVRYLKVRDHTLKVVTDSVEADGLVTETFCPWGMLDVVETAEVDRPGLTIVDSVHDADGIDGLLERTAATTAAGEYELTRGYRLPRYDGEGHSVFVLQDVHSDERAALIRTEDRITIVRPASTLGDRWLTRVIRDIATRIAKAEGALILHSSAFAYEDGAYLVIGDSGAGKSTTAIALARLLPSAGWMGNDRMHLDRRDGGYRVTACPLPLAVNKGSLDVMGVTGFESWPVRAGLPKPGSDWDQFQGEDKLKLSSREVREHLGVRVVPSMPLAGVILPRVDLQAEYSLEPSAPDHTAEVVTRNCFSLDDNLFGENWLRVAVEQRVEPPSVTGFLEHIARLPVLRATVGGPADVARLAEDFRALVGERPAADAYTRPFADAEV
ncbi:hypothetical protein [Streptomyces sp. NPDC047841]|uniref:hypothetical protein n=1 Tax=Streptomyces sp. NPDC047841 TaxID=3154708 RepID=UPI00345516D4